MKRVPPPAELLRYVRSVSSPPAPPAGSPAPSVPLPVVLVAPPQPAPPPPAPPRPPSAWPAPHVQLAQPPVQRRGVPVVVVVLVALGLFAGGAILIYLLTAGADEPSASIDTPSVGIAVSPLRTGPVDHPRDGTFQRPSALSCLCSTRRRSS